MKSRVKRTEDIEAARRIKRIWLDKKKTLNLTQTDLARELDISPSAVSEYLTGKVPIGLKMTFRLSAILGVDPREIRPEIDQVLEATGLTELRSGSDFVEVSSDDLDVIRKFITLPRIKKEMIKRIILAIE